MCVQKRQFALSKNISMDNTEKLVAGAPNFSSECKRKILNYNAWMTKPEVWNQFKQNCNFIEISLFYPYSENYGQ